MVAADDSYCTMVLMPRDCHLSKLPLGWDQAPMTKSGGVAEGLAWLVISAKSVRGLSAVGVGLRWEVGVRRGGALGCTPVGDGFSGAGAPENQPLPGAGGVRVVSPPG